MAMARHGQPVVLTPFTLSGAMAPVDRSPARWPSRTPRRWPASLSSRSSDPGAPCVYGGFTSNVDMRTGAPAFGTPEYTQAAIARRPAGAPLRPALPLSATPDAPRTRVDAQAAYESEMSLWGAVMGGANLLSSGAGWMEGGLIASFEKLVIDAEMLQMMAEFLQPVVVDEDIARASRRSPRSGPGGHFFGAGPHARALRDGVLSAARLGLAELRELARGRRRRRHAARQRDLEAAARRVQAAAARPGDAGRSPRSSPAASGARHRPGLSPVAAGGDRDARSGVAIDGTPPSPGTLRTESRHVHRLTRREFANVLLAAPARPRPAGSSAGRHDLVLARLADRLRLICPGERPHLASIAAATPSPAASTPAASAPAESTAPSTGASAPATGADPAADPSRSTRPTPWRSFRARFSRPSRRSSLRVSARSVMGSRSASGRSGAATPRARS